MFILEEPYVSPQLRRAATRLGAPVLDNACARRELRGVQLVGDDDFARRYFEQDHPRLYTNSENALGWIRDHLAGSDLPAQIEVLKDKVRFRELLADLDPAYRFEEVRLGDLDAVDPTIFAGPFVAKPAVIERTHDVFVQHLDELGRRAGLRDVPIHVEFRIADDGTVRPIEANPMRFGGWCATDIASHGWGFCPYTAFLQDKRPDWSRLCEEQSGWTTALVVADLPADLDRTRVTAIDYDAFTARFSRPLELRRIEDPRHPVFAFLFVRVRDDELDQLDEILRADLTKYVRLD